MLLIGLPEAGLLPAEAAEAEAVVFALKTRSIRASEAVRQSLAAARFASSRLPASLFQVLLDF